MADFRSRYNVPTEQIIEAARRRGQVPSSISTGIRSAVSGIGEGLKLSESVGNILAKREQRKQLANIVQTPEFQEFNQALGGTAEPALNENPSATMAQFVEFKKSQNPKDKTKDEISSINSTLSGLNSRYKDPIFGGWRSDTPKSVIDLTAKLESRLAQYYVTDGVGEDIAGTTPPPTIDPVDNAQNEAYKKRAILQLTKEKLPVNEQTIQMMIRSYGDK